MVEPALGEAHMRLKDRCPDCFPSKHRDWKTRKDFYLMYGDLEHCHLNLHFGKRGVKQAALIVVPSKVHVNAIWDMPSKAAPFWSEMFDQVLRKVFDKGAKQLKLYIGCYADGEHAHIWMMPDASGSDYEPKLDIFIPIYQGLRAAEGKAPFRGELIGHDRKPYKCDREDVVYEWCAPEFDSELLQR